MTVRELFRRLPIPYWLCIISGIVLGAVLGTRFYWTFLLWGEAGNFRWNNYFVAPFINQALWGFLVPVVYWFYLTLPIKKDSTSSVWIKAVAASIGVALFHEVISYVLWLTPMHILGIEQITQEAILSAVYRIPAGFISQWLEYWIIFLLFAGYEYATKFHDKQVELAKIETQLSDAKLNALKLQLHPHFLFNTLNTISTLSEIDPKGAQRMISKLGNLLRGILIKDKRMTVPLSEEIRFVQDYLDIEQARFNDRLEVKYRIDDRVAGVSVPGLILQPLVENAIKHGFAKRTEGGKIMLEARPEGDDYVELIVSDDGLGTPEKTAPLKEGIGLRNVRERLQLMYKDDYRMSVRSIHNGGFEVRLLIPIVNTLVYETDKDISS
jgi:two-component system LytT family sensor kinase